jgi:hypothetical protein
MESFKGNLYDFIDLFKNYDKKVQRLVRHRIQSCFNDIIKSDFIIDDFKMNNILYRKTDVDFEFKLVSSLNMNINTNSTKTVL